MFEDDSGIGIASDPADADHETRRRELLREACAGAGVDPERLARIGVPRELLVQTHELRTPETAARRSSPRR